MRSCRIWQSKDFSYCD